MAKTAVKEDEVKTDCPSTVCGAENDESKGALLLLKDKVFDLYEEAVDTRDQCFEILETCEESKNLLNQATAGLMILKDLEWKINLIPDQYHGAKKTQVADVFNDNLNQYLLNVSPMLEVCHAPHCKTKQHIAEFRKLLTDWEAETEVVDKNLSIHQFKNNPVKQFMDYNKKSVSCYNYRDHVFYADDFTGYKPLWECEPKPRRFRDVDGDYYFARPETAQEYYDAGPEKAKLTKSEIYAKPGPSVAVVGGYDGFGAAGSNYCKASCYGAGGASNGVSKGAIVGVVALSAALGFLGYKVYKKYTTTE